ncbi:MFS transporter [Desulfonema magnum]|uniref:Drug resistance MFS transporter n=1 Tax=Desulfonema magnum TaxID=45655 RepID=A0A975GTZ8_9BACT|nr:MFS transporter [Desulfonema magnum]QTA92653.1 Drug resistance MFS transporter [Desulfonema magnum]
MKQQFEITENKWLIFSLVAVGVFMSTLDGSIVNIALPSIMHDLVIPLATIEWIPMIYLLTVSSLLLSFGRLSDIRGRRWVYSRGLIVFSLGSLFCGMARNAIWLIAARSFQGVGAAMIMACTPALVIESFPVSERGKAMGMVGAVVASGLTVGPALGGMIIHFFSWQFIFYINIPIGIATALVVTRILKGGNADVSRHESFDWGGAVLLTLSLASFLVAITHGYSWGYISLPIISLLGISVVSVIWLIRIETRILHPILKPSLLEIRLFTLPIIAAVFLFASLFVMTFLMPFYLMHPCGFSVSQAGYIMVTPFAFLFVVSPVSGIISDRIGTRMLCTLGMGILALAFFSLAQLSPSFTAFPIVWRLALVGVGTAIFISPNSAIAMSAVPAAYKGVAAGTVATARNLGMAMGVALAGTIFNSTFYTLSGGLSLKVYRPELEPIFMEAFRYAMAAGGIVAITGMIVAFLRGPERIEKVGSEKVRSEEVRSEKREIRN